MASRGCTHEGHTTQVDMQWYCHACTATGNVMPSQCRHNGEGYTYQQSGDFCKWTCRACGAQFHEAHDLIHQPRRGPCNWLCSNCQASVTTHCNLTYQAVGDRGAYCGWNCRACESSGTADHSYGQPYKRGRFWWHDCRRCGKRTTTWAPRRRH